MRALGERIGAGGGGGYVGKKWLVVRAGKQGSLTSGLAAWGLP